MELSEIGPQEPSEWAPEEAPRLAVGEFWCEVGWDLEGWVE